MDEPSPGRLRLRVVAQPHSIDELGLPGEVDVVGPGGGARRDQRLAVADVRADGADHHLRRFGHGAQRLRVARVGMDERHLGQRRVDLGQPGAGLLQL